MTATRNTTREHRAAEHGTPPAIPAPLPVGTAVRHPVHSGLHGVVVALASLPAHLRALGRAHPHLTAVAWTGEGLALSAAPVPDRDDDGAGVPVRVFPPSSQAGLAAIRYRVGGAPLAPEAVTR